MLGYVLGNFAKDETPWLEALCDSIADNAAILAEGMGNQFQNRIHSAMVPFGLAPEAKGSRISP